MDRLRMHCSRVDLRVHLGTPADCPLCSLQSEREGPNAPSSEPVATSPSTGTVDLTNLPLGVQKPC